MIKKQLSPTSPGEMLLEEFLKPLNISQYKLAKDIGVPQTRISQIIKGKRAITPDTALRLARYFNMTAEFWLNLQMGYELKITRQNCGKQIDEEVHPLDEAA
jgi:addiction module HigA family antidote